MGGLDGKKNDWNPLKTLGMEHRDDYFLDFRSEIQEVGGFGMVKSLAEENSDLRLKIDFRF